MFLVSSRRCLRSIHWSQGLSWEWRCSWSSADRRCTNYIWVINNFIAHKGATYIRGFTVVCATGNLKFRLQAYRSYRYHVFIEIPHNLTDQYLSLLKTKQHGKWSQIHGWCSKNTSRNIYLANDYLFAILIRVWSKIAAKYSQNFFKPGVSKK